MLTREHAHCRWAERAWLIDELDTCARLCRDPVVVRACRDTVARDLLTRRRICGVRAR
jgi:hypothetical protein